MNPKKFTGSVLKREGNPLVSFQLFGSAVNDCHIVAPSIRPRRGSETLRLSDPLFMYLGDAPCPQKVESFDCIVHCF